VFSLSRLMGGILLETEEKVIRIRYSQDGGDEWEEVEVEVVHFVRLDLVTGVTEGGDTRVKVWSYGVGGRGR